MKKKFYVNEENKIENESNENGKIILYIICICIYSNSIKAGRRK